MCINYCSAFLLDRESLVLLGERFREGYPSYTNNPSNNPEQPKLHTSYSYTHAHDVGAHAYYSNSYVTVRAVRDCYLTELWPMILFSAQYLYYTVLLLGYSQIL